MGFVSRCLSNPGIMYREAIQKILYYVKEMMDNVVCYQGSSLCLISYNVTAILFCSIMMSYLRLVKKTCITLSTIKIEFAKYLTTSKKQFG